MIFIVFTHILCMYTESSITGVQCSFLLWGACVCRSLEDKKQLLKMKKKMKNRLKELPLVVKVTEPLHQDQDFFFQVYHQEASSCDQQENRCLMTRQQLVRTHHLKRQEQASHCLIKRKCIMLLWRISLKNSFQKLM